MKIAQQNATIEWLKENETLYVGEDNLTSNTDEKLIMQNATIE